jgi:hypothetical protein
MIIDPKIIIIYISWGCLKNFSPVAKGLRAEQAFKISVLKFMLKFIDVVIVDVPVAISWTLNLLNFPIAVEVKSYLNRQLCIIYFGHHCCLWQIVTWYEICLLKLYHRGIWSSSVNQPLHKLKFSWRNNKLMLYNILTQAATKQGPLLYKMTDS